MLLHFLQEFNGFNRIQGGQLALLKERNYILHDGDINQIIGYIQASPLSDVMLLINTESENAQIYTKRILWMTWYALKMEKMMQGITIEKHETEMPRLKSMLFGEVELTDLPDEDEEDEDFEDADEDDFDDDDLD